MWRWLERGAELLGQMPGPDCFSKSQGALWQPKTVTVAMRSCVRCWAPEDTFVLYHFIVCNWFPTEFVCLVCFAVCFWEYSASLYFNYSKI